jgi:phospholipid-binding lipoprotein MlaA
MRQHTILRVIGTACAALLCLAGCAGAPADQPAGVNDPYETTNRKIFEFDQMLDREFMLPTARAYVAAVPEFGRDRVHDFLANLDIPVTFANDLLQGEGARAGQSLARFGVNSTLGVGGLFDPATHFEIADHSEDFGQTLGVWGVPEGPYIVLPVLGPAPPRDAFGQAADIFVDPLTWVPFKQHIWWLTARQYFKLLDLRARNIDNIDGIERSSVDFYASTRSLYRQIRANEIRNGKPDVKDLPDF